MLSRMIYGTRTDIKEQRMYRQPGISKTYLLLIILQFVNTPNRVIPGLALKLQNPNVVLRTTLGEFSISTILPITITPHRKPQPQNVSPVG